MPLLQTNDPVETYLTPLAYGLTGASFGIVQFYNGREEGEPLRKRQLLKTTLVWFAAGVFVYVNPGEFNEAAVAGAAAGLAPFVNIAADQLLPKSWGGSPNRGIGRTPGTRSA